MSRQELSTLHDLRPKPISRSFLPVALEMNVVFPAPVTPSTAISIGLGLVLDMLFIAFVLSLEVYKKLKGTGNVRLQVRLRIQQDR